jgi:DNA topoisomerase-3
VAGRVLDEAEVRTLLASGRLPRLDGFMSKAGKPFSAGLRLDQGGKLVFDFDVGSDAAPAPSQGQAERTSEQPDPAGRARLPGCPKCGQGHLIEGRRGFGCDRYREGCDFVIWKAYEEHALSDAEIWDLITRAQTGPIETPSGIIRLRLDTQHQVVVERG